MSFFQKSMHDEHKQRTSDMVGAIGELSEAELGRDLDESADHIISRYEYPNVPTIVGDRWEMEDGEYTEGSDCCVVRVFIPFEGDPMMFDMYDSSRPVGGKQFQILNQDVIGRYMVHRERTDRLEGEVRSDIEFLEQWLKTVASAIPRFNESLREYATNEIQKRRLAIAVRNKATEELKSRVRIRRRNDGTEKVIIPVERKRIRLPRSPIKETGQIEYLPEIEMALYEDILETISSMALVMERSPSVFAQMSEEPLRTILLVALNGIYQGEATGETFNGAGKTDILIRHENKNVFIAECLMWRGASALQGKMDQQLFQYAMWRDTKLALIIFNRGTSFSRVISEMKKTVREHPQCLGPMPYQHESGARYNFERHDDPSQRFLLTCLAFDVPTQRE